MRCAVAVFTWLSSLCRPPIRQIWFVFRPSALFVLLFLFFLRLSFLFAVPLLVLLFFLFPQLVFFLLLPLFLFLAFLFALLLSIPLSLFASILLLSQLSFCEDRFPCFFRTLFGLFYVHYLVCLTLL